MLIFSITTTTKVASLSLHDGDRILGEIRIEVMKSHSVGIIEQIDRLLEWTGKKLKDVDNVLVSIGPGSFTGVRIAISVIKGLFYGKNVNIYEVNELDALAYQVYYTVSSIYGSDSSDIMNNIKIYSMIDSGKEKIYYSVYKKENSDSLKKIKDYEVSKLDTVIENIMNEAKKEDNGKNRDKIYIVGDGAFNYKKKIIQKLENQESKIRFPEDRNMKINSLTFTEMFLREKLKKTDIFSLKPDYLEKSQAERDKKERKI